MSRRKAFPIHLFDPEVVHQVDVEVERLFRGMPANTVPIARTQLPMRAMSPV